MIKVAKVVAWITIPFFLLIFYASLLTTVPYLQLSKGMYASHDDIEYDHDYAIERIIGYLNYRYNDLEFGATPDDPDTIMRDTELSHMVDVKNLYTGLRVGAGISLILGVLSILYIKKQSQEELYSTLKNMYIGPMFFTMFVGGYVLIDFNTAFTVFHQIFFTNDDWILYADDVLIQLLPSNFWMVSGLIILLLFSASIGLLYYLNEKYNKKGVSI